MLDFYRRSIFFWGSNLNCYVHFGIEGTGSAIIAHAVNIGRAGGWVRTGGLPEGSILKPSVAL